MSVKSMLPIIGVGSAFAIYGLAKRRRAASVADEPATWREAQRPSGVHPRVALYSDELSLPPVSLGSEFWDAAPESELTEDAVRPSVSSMEAYDALDTEDLSAEWLARATEAPAFEAHAETAELDDPAEIPADSLSMISDASRYA